MPAGWYTVEGQQRYWDGAAWTGHVAPPQRPIVSRPDVSPPGAPPNPSREPSSERPNDSRAQNRKHPVGHATGLARDEKSIATLTHLGGIFFFFVPALIVWQVRKEELISRHAKVALNFEILVTAVVVGLVCCQVVLGNLPILGILPKLALYGALVGNAVLCILGARAANNDELFRYPYSLKLIK